MVDNLSRGHKENVPKGLLEVLDLRETSRLADLMKARKCEAVVHFAAYIAVGESTRAPEMYFSNNVGGSTSLFEAMQHAGVNKLVFSSTAAAYGIPAVVPITEDQPYAPINPYGDSKVMVEKMIGWLNQYRDFRQHSVALLQRLRSRSPSRIRETHDPETHLLPLLLDAVLTGQPMTIFGDDYPTPDGTCIRDYIHVSDLAEAHVLAVDIFSTGASRISSTLVPGFGHSVKEVVDAVERITGKKVPHTIGPRREGDPPFW